MVQFFLGDPQGWAEPKFPGGDADALRDALAGADVQAFIHAPYRINVASTNNRIRIPSRKLLGQQLAAAAAIGAQGLIVHGGARHRRRGRGRGLRELGARRSPGSTGRCRC